MRNRRQGPFRKPDTEFIKQIEVFEKPIQFVVRAAKKQPKLIPRDRVNAIIALHVTSIESRLEGPIPANA